MAEHITEGEAIIEGDGVPCQLNGILRGVVTRGGQWVGRIDFPQKDADGAYTLTVPVRFVKVTPKRKRKAAA